MRELQLIVGRVPTFDVLQRVKQLEVLAQRAGDRAQPAHVFRMSPAGVVTAAIGMRDVRDVHATPLNRRESHSPSSAAAASAASQASQGRWEMGDGRSAATGGPSASMVAASGASSTGADIARNGTRVRHARDQRRPPHAVRLGRRLARRNHPDSPRVVVADRDNASRSHATRHDHRPRSSALQRDGTGAGRERTGEKSLARRRSRESADLAAAGRRDS